MYEMTNFIDPETPRVIVKLINTEKFIDVEELYKTLKEGYALYINDYDEFPSSNTMESLDMKYDDDKGRFYTKYIKFVEKCKEIDNDLSISGYGGVNDILKLKIHEMCHSIDYSFPYGWKHNVR